MPLQQYCLTLDLKDDPNLINQYKEYHKAVWPEVIKSIKDAGIATLNIYNVGNRLFMIIEAEEHFSFQKKNAMDAANKKVQKWEELMWIFQQAVPWAKEGEKWLVMENIFQLPV